METKYYTAERNVQILIYLLKAHNIKRIVASPGATNITFVASVQQDPFFKLFSCVDERSAAYMACGMAEESGEPVVISCTGATASRNYIPGLTEAYYRKLPVLAVTSTQNISKIGHLVPQVIDRRQALNDIALVSEHIDTIYDHTGEDDATIKINRALLELRHNGGGPAHINLTTTYSRDFSVKVLPATRVIRRVDYKCSTFPTIPSGSRVGIVIGAHREFSPELTQVVDSFCGQYNAAVFCDHTSGYHGHYRVQLSIINSQDQVHSSLNDVDILIHIGEVSGDYPLEGIRPKEVWRVSEDGELRDRYCKLSYVFEMDEFSFFKRYLTNEEIIKDSYFKEWSDAVSNVRSLIPELPFSNIWIAQQTSNQIPENSIVHLGILNSLRSWNFFEMPSSVHVASNTGGFGIDGGISTFIGSSLITPEKLHFVFIGDLAFFYDMNVLGNRYVGMNIRILLVNNGKGTEFRMFNHPGAQFGETADEYIAAARHFGNKSPEFVRHIAEDLGFIYLTANDKQSFNEALPVFVSDSPKEKPVIFEVFTNDNDESDALYIMHNLLQKKEDSSISGTQTIKNAIKKAIGPKGQEIIRVLKG